MEKRGLFTHSLLVNTPEKLLLEDRQPGDGSKGSAPPRPLAVPIDGEIPHHSAEPRGETGRAVHPEAPQPSEALVAQLLADEQEAIGSVIGIALFNPNYVKDEGRVRVQEISPSVCCARRRKPAQDRSDIRALHESPRIVPPAYLCRRLQWSDETAFSLGYAAPPRAVRIEHFRQRGKRLGRTGVVAVIALGAQADVPATRFFSPPRPHAVTPVH